MIYYKCSQLVYKFTKGEDYKMTNTDLLKGEIKKHGMKEEEFASLLGMSSASFSYKINNKRSFTVSEIIRICELLDIQDKDAYFFVQNVAK